MKKFILTALILFGGISCWATEYLQPEISRFWLGRLADASPETAIKIQADNDGFLDLMPLVNNQPSPDKEVILEGTLYSDKAGFVLLGFGADWWCSIKINGEEIYSNLRPWENYSGAGGNQDAPISKTNQIIKVWLAEGNNELIMQVRSGSNGCSAAIAVLPPEPEYLARVAKGVQIDHYFPAEPKILVPPFPTNSSLNEDELIINFQTEGRIACGVRYREVGQSDWQTVYELLGHQIRTDRDWHRLVLRDLKPDTEYEYQIIMHNPQSYEPVLDTEVYRVKTLPSKGNAVSFFVISDTQYTDSPRQDYMAGYRKNSPLDNAQMVIHLGDIYNWFSPLNIPDIVLPLCMNGNKFVPYIQIRGNHEYRGTDPGGFFRYFGTENEQSYFAFTAGDAIFIVLDTGEDNPPMKGSTNMLFAQDSLLAAERAWLEELIVSPEFKEAKFKIVFSHAAPHMDGSYISGFARRLTDGIFTGSNPSAPISLWMAGHVHFYARTNPENPAECYARLNSAPDGALMPPSTQFPLILMEGPGFVADTCASFITIDGDTLELTAFDEKGRIFDRVKISPDGKIIESAPGKELNHFIVE